MRLPGKFKTGGRVEKIKIYRDTDCCISCGSRCGMTVIEVCRRHGIVGNTFLQLEEKVCWNGYFRCSEVEGAVSELISEHL